MTEHASAMIAPCDDCGTPGPVLNVNSISNPYMLCGACQYAHLGDIDGSADWGSPIMPGFYIKILNDRVWILSGREAIQANSLTTVFAQELPELIIALQVAQARHEAAQKGAK